MITLLPSPSASLRDDVIGWLTQHADDAGYPFGRIDLAFEATEAETRVGGLFARIAEGWMFVELLAVTEAARGRGHGRALLAAAETEARARGLIGLWLDTYTFEAPDFYLAQGFSEFGRLEGHPPGQARVFYSKRLA